jgi:site-specific recombinase XerC
VPERPVPVLTVDQLRVLFASVAGKRFKDRRDEAILRLFADTGLRLSDLAHLAAAWCTTDHDMTLSCALAR